MSTYSQQLPGESATRSSQNYIVITAFLSLFALVGFAYYGLPFFFDFMTKEYGWSRTIVTSGNALGKLIVAPSFGFIAGWLIDKYGPRRLMMAGVLLMGIALVKPSGDQYLARQRAATYISKCIKYIKQIKKT